MQRFQRIVILAFCMILGEVGQCADGDDVADRIAAGEEFLNAPRVEEWEKYFTEGLTELGKISQISNGRVVTEAWFAGDHMLIKRISPKKEVFTFSNPRYSAMVESDGAEYILTHTDVSEKNSGLVYVDAIGFAASSSVDFSRNVIPRFLQQGKMAVIDYHHDNEKHLIELALTDGEANSITQIVFYDNSPSVLPNEIFFYKGTDNQRHILVSEFVDIKGYSVPTKIVEKGTKDSVMFEFAPNELLDEALCQLTYYGLPEPNEFGVTDFGRGRSWRRTIIISLVLLGIAFAILARYREKILPTRS